MTDVGMAMATGCDCPAWPAEVERDCCCIGGTECVDGVRRMPKALTYEEAERRFSHHPPDEARVRLHEAAREVIMDAAIAVTEGMEASREMSLALTALEEAMFWVNAHIARNVR